MRCMSSANNVGPQNSEVLPSHLGTSTYEYFLNRDLLATCFVLVSCLVYSSTLKMEATRSSGKSAESSTDYVVLYP
jgi:hypothetical protein